MLFGDGEGFRFELPTPPDAPLAPEPPDAPMPPMPPRLWGHGGDPGELLQDMFRQDLFRTGPRRLGVATYDLTDQLARHYKVDDGVLVTRVDEGSPAAAAGVQAGDVIVKVDGDAIGDTGDLRTAVAGAKEEATLTVQRDGRPVELKVKLRPVTRRAKRSDL